MPKFTQEPRENFASTRTAGKFLVSLCYSLPTTCRIAGSGDLVPRVMSRHGCGNIDMVGVRGPKGTLGVDEITLNCLAGPCAILSKNVSGPTQVIPGPTQVPESYLGRPRYDLSRLRSDLSRPRSGQVRAVPGASLTSTASRRSQLTPTQAHTIEKILVILYN